MSLVQDMIRDLEARKADIKKSIQPQLDELAEIERALIGLRGNSGGGAKRGRRGRVGPGQVREAIGGDAARQTNKDRVLSALSESAEPLTGSEIARRAGMDSPTAVYPILKKLVNVEGVVAQDEDKRYRIAGR